jgi:dethiobiotin synthetase
MPGRLLVVSGTGTAIGKTHLAEALLLAWQRLGARVIGLKPVESGATGTDDPQSDGQRLARASSFHVKHRRVVFPEPLSPHLCVRMHGVAITPDLFVSAAASARNQSAGTVLELPGGLFSPVAPALLNADVAAALKPDALLLVAPDRLGVLHEVVSTVRAAAAMSLPIHAAVLIEPEHPDASTGLNAAELRDYAPGLVVAAVPRSPARHLALLPELSVILQLARR